MALTVDVEDWRQSTLDPDSPVGEGVERQTRRLLDLLAAEEARASFLVQGPVARRHPSLVRAIRAAGHEVGTHGWSHRPLWALGPARFRRELDRAVGVLEDLLGEAVLSHRAADFSVDARTPWVWEELAARGIRRDSSVFPARTPRYGVASAPLGPWQAPCGVLELPPAVVTLGPWRFPVAGGGWLRLAPWAWTAWGLGRVVAEGRPAVVYLHPYELDPDEAWCEVLSSGASVARRLLAAQQGLGRAGVAVRLRRVLALVRGRLVTLDEMAAGAS